MAAPRAKRARKNDEIQTDQVRLIDDAGEQAGIMALEQALEIAYGKSLDLVEVSPNAEPPVCRIMDYGKYLFEESKRQHLARKKQKQIHVKEVKFRPGTDVGDYQVKLRNLIRFLEAGDKVKITMRFRGREMAHKEVGRDKLDKVKADLDELAVVEQYPKMEGRQMVMVMAPKKK